MTLAVEVYSAANALVGTLSQALTANWQDQLNEVGSGSTAVDRLDAQLSLLAQRRLVKFRLDGTIRSGFVIGPRSDRELAQGEEADEDRTVSGPGFLSLLERALLEPQLGTEHLGPDFRLFNFANPEYDDTSWPAAVELFRQDDPVGSFYGVLFPETWQDGGAFWIWSVAPDFGFSPPTPVGDVYIRTTFTLAEEKSVRVFFSADDGATLYIDGAEVAGETAAFIWKRVMEQTLFLDAGTHTVAVKATNIDRPASPATNGAAFIFAAYSMAAGGELDTLILHSDSTWKCLGYPASVPGMTPGEVLRIVLDEAHAGGYITEVTQGAFTDTLDSDGNAWAKNVDLGWRVGVPLLEVVRGLIDLHIDVRVNPDTLALEAYNKGGLGGASGVTLATAVNFGDLTFNDRPAVATDVLGRNKDGRYRTFSSGNTPKVRAFIESGATDSDEQLTEAATEIFNDHGEAKITATFVVEDITGDRPYVDFGLGDSLTIPAQGGGTMSARVIRLGGQLVPPAEDGIVGGTVEFTCEAVSA